MQFTTRCYAILITITFLLPGCAFRRITRTKNITYKQADKVAGLPPQQLNVFTPQQHKNQKAKPVLVFIHGGNWTSGHKSLYNWFGSRMARKGIVTVIIDYPLSPAADWHIMAKDVAQSLKWVKENISNYGGDPDRVFVSGHSAGGHLAAIVTLNKPYFQEAGIADPVQGLILIDAAGLDMYGYLKDDGGLKEEPGYAITFGKDPAGWIEASPLYHLHQGMPPMLIFQGGRTYPSISRSNEKFVAALRALGESPQYYVLPGKKHIPMITQFFNTGNPRYKQILTFMHGH